jgi:hypothetical protein
MDIGILISALLAAIGFLLSAIFLSVQKVSRNVEQLMINEAAHKAKLEELQRRIENIEPKNVQYGKR